MNHRKLGSWFFGTLEVSTRTFPAAVTRHDLHQAKKSLSIFSNQKALPSRHFWQTKPGNHTRVLPLLKPFLRKGPQNSSTNHPWSKTDGSILDQTKGYLQEMFQLGFPASQRCMSYHFQEKIVFWFAIFINQCCFYIAIAACFSFYACRSLLKWSPPFCSVSENCQPTWNYPTTRH